MGDNRRTQHTNNRNPMQFFLLSIFTIHTTTFQAHMGIVCSYVSHQLQLHKFDRAENPKCLHKIEIQIRKYPKREVKSSSSNNNNTKNDIEPTHQNPTQNIIEIIIFIFVSFVCYRCVCVCIMAVDSSKLCRKLPLMLFFLSCLVRLPGIRL